MDKITEFFRQFGSDLPNLLIMAGVIFGGLLVILLLGKFIFGKHSSLQWAVSSAIAILFTYLAIIGMHYAGPRYDAFVAPMPFGTIRGDSLILFAFADAHYTEICAHILRMIVLAFLVNVIDRWMPQRRNLFAWLFFRMLTVICALLVHLIVCALWNSYIPVSITTYAPVVLLAILLLSLLTGALKLLVGVLLGSVNPLVGGLYTFFFATVVGKKITRAILTTGIIMLLILVLSKFGITSILITPYALLTYLPLFLCLTGFWYLIHHSRKKL